MKCLFCNSGQKFTTVEHIIPQSLGNDELLLTKEICDKCQNYLSQNENYVLNKTPIGFWRTLLTIRTKKGKLAKIDFTKADNNKIFPDTHGQHDNIIFKSHSDFTTELIYPEAFQSQIESGKLTYVLTPKVIYEIGRFLGKVAIGLLCMTDRNHAREKEFDELREYVRHGSMKDLWPIFHRRTGEIKDLFTYTRDQHSLKEDVECYSYSLVEIGPYQIFNFKVGTDTWSICINQKFPHPSIAQHMGQDTKAIWYSRTQFRK